MRIYNKNATLQSAPNIRLDFEIFADSIIALYWKEKEKEKEKNVHVPYIIFKIRTKMK